MKKMMFVLIALLMSTSVMADTFISIYGVSTQDITSNAGEQSKGYANLAFGQSTDGDIGLGYEAFFNNAGLGGSVGAFAKVGIVKVSLGVISVPDNARRAPVENWPVASSTDNGEGMFVGLSTKLSGNKTLSVKYIRYDVNHMFTSTKQTGIDENDDPVFTRMTGSGEAEREQLWIGITFHI